MTLTYELGLVMVTMTHQTKYLSVKGKLIRKSSSEHKDTQTADRLHHLDHKVVDKNHM